MKNKKILLFTLLLLSIVSFSQKKGNQFTVYSTLGLKGSLGFSNVKNSNMDSDNNLGYKSGTYKAWGFKTSINYIGRRPKYTVLGVNFDYLFGAYPIKFSEMKTDLGNYSKIVDLKTNDMVLTFRYTNAKGHWFIEVGEQFSFFRSVTQTNTISDSLFTALTGTYNYESSFQNYTSYVLGVGYFYRGFAFSVRYISSLKSINTDGTNPAKDGYYNNSLVNSTYSTQYATPVDTKQGTIQFTLEFYIPFFAFGRASCGGKGYSFFRGIDNGYYWGSKRGYKGFY